MKKAIRFGSRRGQSPGILLFILACVVAGWGIFYSLQRAPVDADNSSYQRALGEARADGRHVLLVFTAGWCGPCRHMKATVYPDSRVRTAAQKFEWVTVDVDRRENQDLSRKFGIRGIPAHVIVNSQGGRVASRSGACSVSEFAGWLRKNSP